MPKGRLRAGDAPLLFVWVPSIGAELQQPAKNFQPEPRDVPDLGRQQENREDQRDRAKDGDRDGRSDR